MASTKDIRQLERLALDQGWRVEYTKNMHVRFYPLEGPFIVGPGSPSDHRGVLNFKSLLRRAGLKGV